MGKHDVRRMGVACTTAGAGCLVAAFLAAGMLCLAPSGGGDFGLPVAQAKTYTDVAGGSWYTGYVDFVSSRGAMGDDDGDGAFGVDAHATRADAVVALWVLAGSPKVELDGRFSDVANGDARASAIAWAAELGIASGYAGESGAEFRPDEALTREQLACVVYRRAGAESGGDLSGVSDAADAADWAKPALSWCLANGILTADEQTAALRPTDSATRAELARALTRLTLLPYLPATTGQAGSVGDASSASAVGQAGDTSAQTGAAGSDRAGTASATGGGQSPTATSGSSSTTMGGSSSTAGSGSSSASTGASSAASTSGSADPSSGQTGVSSSSQAGSAASTSVSSSKKWVVDQAAYDERVLVSEAYDEQVLVSAAYDEQVLVSAAWDEQVLVSDAYDEQVVVREAYTTTRYTGVWYYCFSADGYVTYDSGDAYQHAIWLDQNGYNTSYSTVQEQETVTIPAEYSTVHHDAEYTTVHHDAEYSVTHHDAQYSTVHHAAEYTTVHHDEVGHWE